MRKRPDLLSPRILGTIKLAPMTVKQIADALCASDESVRQLLFRMEERRQVRRAGFAPRSKFGTTPYLWVAL
jgi:hypothetical protein